MSQFDLEMFATNFKVYRTDVACPGSPRKRFLSLSLADLEIIIEKSSRIVRRALPAFAHTLDREVRELDFLTGLIPHTRPVRSHLFGRRMAETDRTDNS